MEIKHQPVAQSEIEAGYAKIDVRGRGFLYFLIAFVAVAVVIHIILWLLYGVLVQTAPSRPASPLAEQNMPPPAPQVQGTPSHPTFPQQDMQALLAREREWLNSYGWANRQAGYVHIPIGQAMNMLLQRGLPTTQPTTATAPGER